MDLDESVESSSDSESSESTHDLGESEESPTASESTSKTHDLDIVFDPFEHGSWAARHIGNEWPDDTVIYPADQVGNFRRDGVVLMSDTDMHRISWSVDEFSKVDDPERFDREYGLWVDDVDIRDDVLDERLVDAPEPGVKA